MKSPKSMPRNTLRRNHLLDGFCWSGQNLQVLSYLGLAEVTSSKKGVSPGTYRGRTWPVTMRYVPRNPTVLPLGPHGIPPGVRRYVRSRYLKGVVPLIRSRSDGAAGRDGVQERQPPDGPVVRLPAEAVAGFPSRKALLGRRP